MRRKAGSLADEFSKKDPPVPQAGRIVSETRDVRAMAHLHATHSFVKLSEFDVDLFGHKPNIIGRPEPPKRELAYSVDRWVTLGTPALKVLTRLARDAVKT
jgi:hypothetical protein